MSKKKTFTTKFKVQVVLEALSELKTTNEIASKYEIAPMQVHKWKWFFKKNAEKAMIQWEGKWNSSGSKTEDEKDKIIEKLYREVWKLQVENTWMKKKVGFNES